MKMARCILKFTHKLINANITLDAQQVKSFKALAEAEGGGED